VPERLHFPISITPAKLNFIIDAKNKTQSIKKQLNFLTAFFKRYVSHRLNDLSLEAQATHLVLYPKKSGYLL
jgi:hypothetical protein